MGLVCNNCRFLIFPSVLSFEYCICVNIKRVLWVRDFTGRLPRVLWDLFFRIILIGKSVFGVRQVGGV